MKICDILGKGGSFCEIVAMDYIHNTMLLGHDGPFHISISDGKPMLRGLGVYHGKKGSGISVEANVISGPVTMLGLTQLRNGRLRFIVSEGIAKKFDILTIGNTQTHVDFGIDLDAYMDAWFKAAPTHHCAMSVGHNASLFEKTAKLMGIEFVRVNP
jgi:L-arabinose isomerase